jgi:Kef-type K+ transport system membrane component KefB
VTGCLGFALFFGTSLSDAVIVGGCLALSSTPVAVGALTREEHRQPHGELLLGSVVKSVSLPLCSNNRNLSGDCVEW